MAGKQFFIETKFDGERMLLHKQKGEYKYFSRRLVKKINTPFFFNQA